jgi:mono/diheme cytochrome c family protein
MKKIIKIIGLVFGTLLSFGVLFYFYASYRVDQRLATKYDVTPEELVIPDDSASISKGKHLVDIKGCRDCHGDNLGGKLFNDDFFIGTLAGPNLTKGKGGLPADYPIANWVKAIRHGLDNNNYPLMVMPSLETSKMSKEDLQNMISFLRTLPLVDNALPESELGIMIKTMVHLDEIALIPAEQIDHNTLLIDSVDTTSPEAHGKYLSVMCSGCHHENMKGGDPMAPGFPPVPDLTSTGAAGRWTQEQFNTALRTGNRPDGTILDPNMPVEMTQHYSDAELHALYTFLKTL